MDKRKGFISIPRSKCLETSLLIIKSTENRKRVYDKLYEEGDFKEAISLHISVLEEHIKALILRLDSHGFNFRSVNELNRIFTNHEFRYYLSFLIFFSNIFVQDVSRLPEIINKRKGKIGKILEHLLEIEDEKQRLALSRVIFMSMIPKYLIDKLSLIQVEIKWFQGLDNLKQDVFYSGYTENLILNDEISDDFIVELKIRMNVVLECIDNLMNDEILNSTYSLDLRKQLKEEGLYDDINQSLVSIRKSKEDSFDQFIEYFSKITEVVNEGITSGLIKGIFGLESKEQ